MNELELEEVRKTAKKEIEEELFRAAVDKEKERLRKVKPLMDKIFPWKIIIIRKDHESRVGR